MLINLNHVNGADVILLEHAEKLLSKFPEDHLVGCEMGIAYGGGVEAIGKMWKGRGTIYGFDTFESLHPKHLADDATSFEATCMDYWYIHPEYGTDKLSYDYQRQILDDQKLDNVILIKGEVSEDSCKSIDKIHYALLDMDIKQSMQTGYHALRDKFVPGGLLFIHDTQNIGSVGDWYAEEVLGTDAHMWKPFLKADGSLLVGLERLA